MCLPGGVGPGKGSGDKCTHVLRDGTLLRNKEDFL